jgi:hypothetical protein
MAILRHQTQLDIKAVQQRIRLSKVAIRAPEMPAIRQIHQQIQLVESERLIPQSKPAIQAPEMWAIRQIHQQIQLAESELPIPLSKPLITIAELALIHQIHPLTQMLQVAIIHMTNPHTQAAREAAILIKPINLAILPALAPEPILAIPAIHPAIRPAAPQALCRRISSADSLILHPVQMSIRSKRQVQLRLNRKRRRAIPTPLIHPQAEGSKLTQPCLA